MIHFSGAAQRDLRKLDGTTKRRIAKALRGIEGEPRKGVEVRKLAGGRDLFRLRVGECRVVYEVIGNDLLVSVVAHRREVYRKARRRRR